MEENVDINGQFRQLILDSYNTVNLQWYFRDYTFSHYYYTY